VAFGEDAFSLLAGGQSLKTFQGLGNGPSKIA
jgi:hypothetical protein